MNRIDKFLSKLSVKDRVIVEKCLGLVKSREFGSLDFKKLKGFDKLYRLRQARIRIIFYMDERKIEIIKIDRRNSNTYKDL